MTPRRFTRQDDVDSGYILLWTRFPVTSVVPRTMHKLPGPQSGREGRGPIGVIDDALAWGLVAGPARLHRAVATRLVPLLDGNRLQRPEEAPAVAEIVRP
jgi:hypothetical protein